MNKLFRLLFLSKIKIKEFFKFLLIEEIKIQDSGKFIIEGARLSDFSQLDNIYFLLNGKKLSQIHKFSLIFNSNKRLLVVKKKTDNRKEIVGMNFYYLNSRDFKEGTIHEGFIGVMTEFEGRGVATQMRKHAQFHFKKAGFSGISTRISENNLGSLHSAEKLGFKSIDEYKDPVTNEKRFYMISNFRKDCE